MGALKTAFPMIDSFSVAKSTIRTSFTINRLYCRLCYVVKSGIQDFYPILQNFTYILKHPVLLTIKCTPLQSSYKSSIRYVERFYLNFLLKTPNFIDLSHFFLNRVFHNKNWKVEFVPALFFSHFGMVIKSSKFHFILIPFRVI